MHPLLARQIRRCHLPPGGGDVDVAWRALLERVSRTYAQADDERLLQERMMVTLSAEMQQLNDSLRASESCLAHERDMLEAVVLSIADGLCVFDFAGRMEYVNPAALRLLGARREALIGKGLPTLCPELEWPETQTGTPMRAEDMRFHRQDGGTLLASCVLSPVLRGGEPRGAVLVFRDIGEQRRLERELHQSQRLESVGRLAGGLAHELNTPVQYVSDSIQYVREVFGDLERLLGTFRGLCRGVLDGTAGPQEARTAVAAEEEADVDYALEHAPKAFQRSLEGLQRIASVIRSMKDLAPSAGHGAASIDLNRVLESALFVVSEEIDSVADLDVALGELPHIVCDASDVTVVLLNLLRNAAQAVRSVYGETGLRGRITVRTRVDGDEVEVEIGDTGPGIPEAVREHIFDPFFTTREVGSGAGQGLSVARSIVVGRHGGSLALESEEGSGSTFFLRLPVQRVQHRPEVNP